MGYKEKASREQIMLLPDSIEEYVGENNPVRVIDAFVDSLDLVNALCTLLNCQPGDIMEYVPDETEGAG